MALPRARACQDCLMPSSACWSWPLGVACSPPPRKSCPHLWKEGPHASLLLVFSSTSIRVLIYLFVFLPFLGPFPCHMEVPRLGVESEL